MLSDLTFSVARSVDLHVNPLVPLDAHTSLLLSNPLSSSEHFDAMPCAKIVSLRSYFSTLLASA
jgi:hypothetical protein